MMEREDNRGDLPTISERMEKDFLEIKVSESARLTLLMLCVAGALLLPANSLQGQVSSGGRPVSFSATASNQFQTVVMPGIDVAVLLAEDSAQAKEEPFRFGYPFQVDYDLDNSGTWTQLPNGDLLWRLRIVSAGAFSINLVYDYYELPEGARFFVYGEATKGAKQQILGAFTAANNKEHKMFATAPIPGDRVILEYYEPVDASFPGKISVANVVHAYRNLFSWEVAKEALGFGSSGSCNNNVNCPEGQPWQDEKRSVAMVITAAGSRLCSGTLVNNVRQDQTPYFLTAEHCMGTPESWIFMFNYESPSCDNVDGPTWMTTQGSTIRANHFVSDFLLLEMDEAPPDSYEVYFSGWSALDLESDSAVAIHHPRGDIKKISFDYDTFTSTDYLVDSGWTHWRIGNWEDGTTEPGSSGSPLFNKDHLIVGQLHGGYASCSNQLPDWYGKFSVSWDEGATPATRLRDWLDPDSTGTLTLPGFDPYARVEITHTPHPDTKDTVNAYEIVCTIATDVPLIPDSLLLRYQIEPSPVWHTDTLAPSGEPEEYHGFIPPKPAGTDINYYLYAESESGSADTTEIYTFHVLNPAVTIYPVQVSGTAAAFDTAWYDLVVTSHRLITDSFTLTISGNNWTTRIWDESGAVEISETGPLEPEESFSFKVSVEVPATVFGERDSASVKATSQNSSAIYATALIRTASSGAPLSAPFYEGFSDIDIDSTRWVLISGVDISTDGIGEPSEPYAVNFDGAPTGADTIMSQAIDLAGLAGLNITYFYQRTGGGNPPENGDDLFVEYLNASLEWLVLRHYLGDGPDMNSFELAGFPIPPDGYHSGFRLRFRNIGSVGDYDDWFIDDIRVDQGPDVEVLPPSFQVEVAEGDSTEEIFIVENSGEGVLTYSVVASPDAAAKAAFARLLVAGQVNPAGVDGDDFDARKLFKGDADTRVGPAVEFAAGGPDQFGYIWIDSDAEEGPTFSWIDVLTTGIELGNGLDDDNFTGPFGIGFGFPFYDSVYTHFYLGSNGFIGFGPPVDYDAYQNSTLPNSATPNNIIAWCWDDLNITDTLNPGGRVVYEPTADRCVIQFEDMPEYSGSAGDVIDAEVILYPDGTIRLQYHTIAPGFDRLGSTIGIEDALGGDGLEIARNTEYLHDLLAIEIVRPAAWISVTPAAGQVAGGHADSLSVKFNAAELDSGYYSGTIKVFSNDPDPDDNPIVVPVELDVGGPPPEYTCGDANGDGLVNVTDVIRLVAYVFGGAPPPEPLAAGDVDCNGLVNISDATYLLAYIFGSGSGPCADCP